MAMLSVPNKTNWAPRESHLKTGGPSGGKAHITSPRSVVAELEKRARVIERT